MALDSNIGRIKFMRSKTAGAVPSPSLLDEGELAINLVDRTIFSKNDANTVELGFGKGGTVAGPINVTGGNAVSAAQFNGALNGNAATASRLLTGRKINDVVFDGTKDITIEDSTKLYKTDVLTTAGDSRVIRDAATIRAEGTAKGAVVIHLPKRANSVSTMMKLCIQGFDYASGRATQSNWSVDISGYNYTGAAWHSYQAISTGGPAPFDTVRWGQADNHQVIILGEAGASPSSWTYYNISIEKIYLTSNSTASYDDPNDPIYMAIEADISNYTINATMPLEGVAMAKRLEIGRTFTFTGDARGSLLFDGTANVSTALTINSATTGQAGLVKLNNTLTSTSVTEALTAAQGKALQDTKVNRSGDTISGRLVVTQGITTPSISNDVTVPISFLGPSVNNSNAGGIRVRNLEVNNQYGTSTRAFGIFSKEGIVAGDSAPYASLAAIGTGNNVPFKVNDTNVHTTYGFVPFLGGNVQSSSGYRTVTSIGVYRPGPDWADSGMYIATGSSDGASTEAFLFKGGRTIENTNGPIILKGNADSATKLQTPRTINGVAFDGTSNIRIQQLAEGIPVGADLNTYLTEGFYYCDTNAVAQTIKNGPFTGAAFCLLVERTAGVKQTFTIYSPGSSRTWIRNIYAGTTGAWREVAYTDAPTFTGAGRFIDNLTVNGTTNTTGLINSGTLRSSGGSYLGNQMELGNVGTASPVYIDFHSGASDTDYDARIMSSGGTTAIGNGALSYIAASHSFNGSIGAGIISASSISVSTGLGISNTSNTVLAGLSLYGGAQSGKPTYGITFTGTSNAGTGKHGDLTNATWAVYLTCAASSVEKRGWIFQRSDNNENVASISTAGVLSTSGSIQTLNDNTMINVGNDKDLALVKKSGSKAFIGVGADTPFSVSKSNANWVDPTHTFTELFTVSSAGVANAVGGFTGTFSGTFNGTISGTLTGSLNGNASTATTLQTARAIGITGSGASGSVNFDGSGNVNIPLSVATQATATNNTTIATTAFVQNVNVAETGASAYAVRLKTPRSFQITGGITTNAVAFDGQQNVVLTANAVDGSKVSGVVPEAIKAQTLAVTPQKNAKLVASWKGTILQSMAPTLTIVDANTLRVRLADDNPGNRLAVLRFNVKIGTVYHLAFSNTMLPINGTVTYVNTGLTWVEVDLNAPNHGLSGSGLGVNVMAITYSAYGCYFEGTISQIIGTTGPQDSQWAYVLKLNSPTTDATYNLSGSSQDSVWVADKNIWYLNPAQPVITAGAMISPDRLNFFAADTDSSARMRSNMVTAQIWDIV
ncbi:tail fiber protein [Acinetobacter phage vB_AbaM_Konradin]|uniref:Long tail fiber distal subunit n=1 Tax=Acinetobacter phage vB_AbaM_Konradin TaxID=2666257 RepID=A0A650EVF8_9CAUD|nr:tail fiber protein [Acinetobacter phage vB_AbaM_Konradin]QGT54004.1 long tail fiber distal subunit [Acinetobacter phage vB_AbaM_Konradin]